MSSIRNAGHDFCYALSSILIAFSCAASCTSSSVKPRKVSPSVIFSNASSTIVSTSNGLLSSTLTSLTFPIDSTALPSSELSFSLIPTLQASSISSSPQEVSSSSISISSDAAGLSVSSGPNASASLFIITQVSVQPETYIVSGNKPMTYMVREGASFHTFTITGPTTFVTDASLVNVFVTSTPSNATSTISYPVWDPAPYVDYFWGGKTTWNAAQIAAASSFASFGRQSACTAAYSSFIATKPMTTQTFAQVTTFTGSNGQITNGIGFETLTMGSGDMAGACCGSCNVYFNNIQVFYWPESEANTGCLKTAASGANSSATPSHGITARAEPTLVSFVTGSDGFVYTYPSAYVVFPSVHAEDQCGIRGPNITSLTLAVAPGELSSVVGRNPGPAGQGTTLSFNFADLPCGPGNTTISNEFLPNGGQQTLYQPIIAAPSRLLDMEPLWKGCYQDIWQGQDPPVALTRVPALTPATLSVESVIHTASAAPSSSIPALPINTGSPSSSTDPGNSNSNPPNSGNADPPSSGISNPPNNGNSNPPKSDPTPNADPSQAQDASHSPKPASDPAPIQSLVADFPPMAPINPPSPSNLVQGLDPSSVHVDPQSETSKSPDMPSPVIIGGELVTPVPGSSGVFIFRSQTLTPGQGLITIAGVPISLNSGSVFINGQGAPIPTTPTPIAPQGVNNPQAVPVSPVLVGGQTASIANPSVIIIGTQTAFLNQPAITVSGTPVSFGSAGIILGNSKTIPLLTPATATASPIATVAGQVITALPAPSGPAIAVDGTTLTPNAPGLTISGTPISLGPSGILVIGTSTVTLPLLTPTPTPTYIQIGRNTIGIEASAIVVAGTTLTPGSPGVTVDGTIVSLGSGVLVVGGRTETLSVPAGQTAGAQSDGGGAGGSGGLAPLIMSGLGQIGGAVVSSLSSTATGGSGLVFGGNGTDSGMPFTGAAARTVGNGMGPRPWLWSWVGGLCVMVTGRLW